MRDGELERLMGWEPGTVAREAEAYASGEWPEGRTVAEARRAAWEREMEAGHETVHETVHEPGEGE